MAGLKKSTAEWLSGYAMISLSQHWVFTPIRAVFGSEITDLVIIHWFTCVFDLTIAIWLIYKPTRIPATILCALFHLMNSQLFSIGMFPWLCLAELPLFYERSWPRKLRPHPIRPNYKANSISFYSNDKQLLAKKAVALRQKVAVVCMLLFCSTQLALPHSHFITKGYNTWTNGIYGYSWDMMVHAWDTVLVVVQVENSNGDKTFLNPYAYTDNDRWTKHPDLVYQYAHCINRKLEHDLKSYNNSIYIDVWCSLNGRFQQRIFQPNVNILKEKWSPFSYTSWTKPLLHSFTFMRPKLIEIRNEVLKWSSYSDVIFVADFPKMQVDHYVSNDLVNVTLFVLEGVIAVRNTNTVDKRSNIRLSKGEYRTIRSGATYTVETIGGDASCYMYTFMNRTLRYHHDHHARDKVIEDNYRIGIWRHIVKRLENYKQFVGNIFQTFSLVYFEYFLFYFENVKTYVYVL